MRTLALLTLASATILHAQTAKEIVQKANDLLYGKSTYSEVTMTITKPTWSRSVSMKVWAVEPDYSIVYITDPARDRGTVTLKRKNEVWNYLPGVQKTIKIPPSMMLASWMGSDFTNDDLVRQSSIVNDYTHALLGEETIDNRECYKIALTPKPGVGVVWGKIIVWISKKEYMELKQEFYDEDGGLVRTMTGTKPRNFDGHLIPSVWNMTPQNTPGSGTTFEYKDLRFGVDLTPDFFSLQNMTRIR